MINNKYVSPEYIFSRLASLIKNKEYTLPEVARWCADCVVYEIKNVEDMLLFEDVQLHVKNQKALAPDNMFRLLEVRRNGQMVPFRHDGKYLFFKSSFDKVTVRYYGVPIDPETGYVLIGKDQQKACLYYCLKMLNTEDFLAGKVPMAAWQHIDNEFTDGVSKALGSNRNQSRNDDAELSEIMANMIVKIGHMSSNLD